MNQNFMKKIICMMLSVLMVMSILPMGVTVAFAQESGNSDFEYSVISEEDKTAQIDRYYGTDSDIVFPSEIDGYKIVSIPSRVFRHDNKVKNVTIPESITEVTAFLFKECPYIENIYVSKNNSNYIDINGVLFDKGITNLIKYPNARTGEYTIPSTVIHIGNYAFKECGGVTNVEIANSVVDIGVEGFSGCTRLKSITIPDRVEIIANHAFWGCSSMTEVFMGKGVIGMTANVFGNCSSLTAFNVDENNTVYSDINGVLVNKEKTMLITCPAGLDN